MLVKCRLYIQYRATVIKTTQCGQRNKEKKKGDKKLAFTFNYYTKCQDNHRDFPANAAGITVDRSMHKTGS